MRYKYILTTAFIFCFLTTGAYALNNTSLKITGENTISQTESYTDITKISKLTPIISETYNVIQTYEAIPNYEKVETTPETSINKNNANNNLLLGIIAWCAIGIGALIILCTVIYSIGKPLPTNKKYHYGNFSETRRRNKHLLDEKYYNRKRKK